MVLDILFTGILGWGVAGAAWATIIGQAVSFLFSLFFLYRHRAAFGFEEKAKKEAAAKEILEHANVIVASDYTFSKLICRS